MPLEIKDKIRMLRTELGLTMRELSLKIGVTEATVSRWESGNIANMRRDKIADLAEALQTTPAYLMGWTDNPSPQAGDDTKTNTTIQEPVNPDIRMIARAGKKMTAEQAENLRKYAEFMFPEAFEDK